MARTSDAEKFALWQQRLADFDSSSMTVAQFCRSSACSVASFYQWRRKLNTHSHPLANRAADKRGKSASAFVPVQVLSGGHRSRSESGGTLLGLSRSLPSASVVVTLSNGTRIELACDAQAALLSILQQQESE